MKKKKAIEIIVVAIMIFLTGIMGSEVLSKLNLPGMTSGVIYYVVLISTIIVTVKVYEKESMKSLGLYTSHLKKQVLIGGVIFLALSLVTIVPLLMGVNKNEVLNLKPNSLSNNHNIPQVISATIVGVIFAVCKLKIKKCGLISLALAHGLNDAFIIFLGYFLL